MEVFFAIHAVQDFYENLPRAELVRTERLIVLLRCYGNRLRLPHSRALGDGLFELRLNGKHAVRLIYCYLNGGAYLLHGLVKKTGTLLSRDIEQARRIRAALIADS